MDFSLTDQSKCTKCPGMKMLMNRLLLIVICYTTACKTELSETWEKDLLISSLVKIMVVPCIE